MQRLKEEFEKNGGTWKEFKLSEVFKVETTKKKFNAVNVKFGGKYPYIVRTALNNGVKGFITEDEKFLNPARTISFGQDTATMFYQEQPYFTGDKIKILTLKGHDLTNKIACFLISIMGKAFKNFKWGQSSFNEKVLNNVRVKLPITLNSQIDFDYMERYISELEEERISELAAYLKVTGLENCVLTKPEKLALKSRGGGNLRKFKIVDLFTVKNTHSILNSWIVPNSGVYPYVTAGESNNSILTYINYDSAQLEDENAILIGGKTTVITYQEKEFFSNDSHNLALYLKDSSNVSKNVSLFLITSLSKALKPIYSWGNSISKRKIQKDYISLPATKTGTPDYEFMETYIRALEKVVIRGVVDWKDRIIKTTKGIVYRK